MKIDKLVPHLTYKVWGGEKLQKLKSPKMIGEQSDPLGETWEVSRHRDGSSKTLNGASLAELYSEKELPYLVKFIDTAANLSVQVHPDDAYARKNENDLGKTECWIIIDAAPGAGIYLGLKEGVTKDQFEKYIKENKNVNELLNFYEVKSGDFFFVPAQTIHAIGENVTLCEVQQSSGITYRVWDWNRLGLDGKPRELHVEKALDVIDFSKDHNRDSYFQYQENCWKESTLELANHADFKVDCFNMKKGEELKLESNSRVSSLVLIEGSLEVGELKLGKYECMAVSNIKDDLYVKLSGDSKFIVVS
ncbi:MAG: hypothetical protein BM556_07955 [Bacteriovorax sp. MedPE-SWde]|nr:MAG: hypothetical protein BM556_07955 [Bacteriovorax sp. MedPE-SWde]